MQLTLLSLIALAVTPFAPAVSAGWHPTWSSPDSGYAPSKPNYDADRYSSNRYGAKYGENPKSSGYWSDDDDDDYSDDASDDEWSSQPKYTPSKWDEQNHKTSKTSHDSWKSYGNSYASGNDNKKASNDYSSWGKKKGSKGSKYPKPSSGGTKSVKVRYDTFYDNPAGSMNGVACSNGEHGLVDKFPKFENVPNFPYLAAAPVIEGWNSVQCGTCWELSYNGKTIYVTAIDRAADSWNLSLEAMNKLTNGQAQARGFVDGVQLRSADPSKCSSRPY